jgi:D-glycero-alpha-D-manno-heptose-7-phosphate kinase
MRYNARAPLRIGLAGGGTDVSPYTDEFGGLVINATIDLFAHVSLIRSTSSGVTIFTNNTIPYVIEDVHTVNPVDCPPPFDLYAGALKWFANRYGYTNLNGITISSSVDVPLGSGLGTSSTLMVALVGVLLELRNEKLSPSEIAAIAYEIERIQLGHAGGRQDQYAASFGGLNAMHFLSDTSSKIESIVCDKNFLKTLESRLILYYTAHDRFSSVIIKEQMERASRKEAEPLSAMHQLKMQAEKMKSAFLNKDFHAIARLLDSGFQEKKRMATGISTPVIEEIYKAARHAGAIAGKISGAGGGGFMVFYSEEEHKAAVTESLCTFGGKIFPFSFTEKGLESWKE